MFALHSLVSFEGTEDKEGYVFYLRGEASGNKILG